MFYVLLSYYNIYITQSRESQRFIVFTSGSAESEIFPLNDLVYLRIKSLRQLEFIFF